MILAALQCGMVVEGDGLSTSIDVDMSRLVASFPNSGFLASVTSIPSVSVSGPTPTPNASAVVRHNIATIVFDSPLQAGVSYTVQMNCLGTAA